MSDEKLEENLERAAQARDELDPALPKRIAASIEPSMRPVRRLPPKWKLAGGLMLIGAAVSAAGAARAGFYGIEKQSLLERATIYPTLAMLLWLSAAGTVNEMTPGSRRRIGSRALLGIVSLTLMGLFAMLFRNYRTDRFVSQGIGCLVTGLLLAVPAGMMSWWVLRRSFAVNFVAAGLAAGTLAGLAGVAMLELHCENSQALHVLVWHTAVVPLSGAAGALLGLALRFRRVPIAETNR